MKLHVNVRSCPASRRLMCERVEDGWTVEEAADAAGFSQALRVSVAGPVAWRRRRARGSVVGAEASREPHAEDGPGRHRTVASVADDLDEDRRGARHGGLDGGCGSARLGLHRLSRLEPLEAPNRYCRRARGRAYPRRRQEARTFRSSWPPCDRTCCEVRNRGASLGVYPRRGGRLHLASCMSRSSPTNALPTTVVFYDRALACFATSRRDRRAYHERQRAELPFESHTPRSAPNVRSVSCSLSPYRPRTNGKA